MNQDVKYLQFRTSAGSFEVELYYKHSPITCNYFVQQAINSQYYNDTSFHTIQKNHVIIGGDPTNTGKGGKEFDEYQNEIDNGLKHVGAGIIGMCEKSQFYITLSPTPWLDGKYCIFGRISSGMSTLKAISLVSVSDEKPEEDITIYKVIAAAGK
ncbi:hypothetical protein ABK040_016600 [Willaertia magna]